MADGGYPLRNPLQLRTDSGVQPTDATVRTESAVNPDNEQDDLPYVSELRFGTFAAILAAILLVMTHLLETGTYHPTREDKLWALHSRATAAHAEPLDNSTVVSLRRTAAECFSCPQYSVRILGSGKVEYVGDQFVCAFGMHEAVADARAVRRLVEAMIASGYFGFAWKKGPYGLDASSATSVLRHRGQSYQIYDYHGDYGAPRWLRAMEDEIDRVAGTARWLPESSTFRCPDPAGGTRVVTMREPLDN